MSFFSTLDKAFKLTENKTSVRTEVLSGFTTFVTMAYILFVNPMILSNAGMSPGAVFVATCLVSACGCLLVGCLSNYPIAIAPGVANIYFAFIVNTTAVTWQGALGAVFISGIIFYILTITKVRQYILLELPESFNTGIAAGLGFFIAMWALKHSGLGGANENIMALAGLHSPQTMLFILGFSAIVIMDLLKIPGAILISVVSVSLLGILLHVTPYHGLFAMPPSIMPTLLALNFSSLFSLSGWMMIFTFTFVVLFNGTATFVAVLEQIRIRHDSMTRLRRALMVDSTVTVVSGLLGTSSVMPFIESVAGARAGGRTGLTAVVIGLLFLIALFFSPLAENIPGYAVAPALLFVAILMIKTIVNLDWDDYLESVPALLTAITMPFTFSIVTGVAVGLISYVLLHLLTGNRKLLNKTMLIMAVIFAVYLVIRFAS